MFRVAGASLLVAVVVAWPRLAPPEPALPATEATPLVGDESLGEAPPPVGAARRDARDRAGEERRAAKAARAKKGRRNAARMKGRRTRDGATRGRRTRRVRTKRDRAPATNDGATMPPTNAGGSVPAPSAGGSPPAATTTPAADPAQTEFGFESGRA